ncbi:MAG: hypothetical protein SGARI_000368 [Bacillariaceae sp.]
MSDLFPLVATVLKDKAAVDAQKEVEDLKKQLGAVKIVRSKLGAEDDDDSDSEIVFASGQFQDGKLGKKKNLWWKVDLEASSDPCSFSDLLDIDMCVGGGFPLTNFSHRLEKLDLHLDGNVYAGEDAPVEFYFRDRNISLGALVKGWPRQEWEPWFQNKDMGTHAFLRFLTENVRMKYPEATFQFRYVFFLADEYRRSLKQLVPASRRKKLFEEFDESTVNTLTQAVDNPDRLDYRSYLDMVNDVMPLLRNLGVGVNGFVWQSRCAEVVAVLLEAGMVDLNDVTQPQLLQISQASFEHGKEEALRVARSIRLGLQNNGGP